MSDADLVARFLAGSLAEPELRHRDHVRVGWLLLARHPLLEALALFRDGLRRLAESFGKAGLYHETITLAYLLLIHERRAAAPPGRDESWERFAARCPELFAWPESILDQFYRPETLRSESARHGFVLPDLHRG
jgi:hypothetical protein